MGPLAGMRWSPLTPSRPADADSSLQNYTVPDGLESWSSMVSARVGFIALAALAATATPQMQATRPGAGAAPTEIVTADGVRLHARADGDGRPLVVLHGGPGLSSSYLRPDLQVLSDRYRLISYDQRGSGRSTVVADPARLTLEHHVGDVDAVRRHFGLERMVLAGHSWGAAPAAFYARAHPERVAALILLDPIPMRRTPWMQQFGENLRTWMDEATAKRVGELAAARQNAPDPVAACRAYWAVFIRGYMANPRDPTVLGRMRGDVCDDPPAAIANTGVVSRGALGPLGDWDWRDRFHAVKVPVLVVHGAQDPIPIASAEEWQKALPQATLVPIDGAGHFPQVEQPDAFRTALDAFLARHR